MSRCNGDDGHLPARKFRAERRTSPYLEPGEACNSGPFTDTSLCRYLDGRHAKCHAARPATIRLVRLQVLTLELWSWTRYRGRTNGQAFTLPSDDESRCTLLSIVAYLLNCFNLWRTAVSFFFLFFLNISPFSDGNLFTPWNGLSFEFFEDRKM